MGKIQGLNGIPPPPFSSFPAVVPFFLTISFSLCVCFFFSVCSDLKPITTIFISSSLLVLVAVPYSITIIFIDTITSSWSRTRTITICFFLFLFMRIINCSVSTHLRCCCECFNACVRISKPGNCTVPPSSILVLRHLQHQLLIIGSVLLTNTSPSSSVCFGCWSCCSCRWPLLSQLPPLPLRVLTMVASSVAPFCPCHRLLRLQRVEVLPYFSQRHPSFFLHLVDWCSCIRGAGELPWPVGAEVVLPCCAVRLSFAATCPAQANPSTLDLQFR